MATIHVPAYRPTDPLKVGVDDFAGATALELTTFADHVVIFLADRAEARRIGELILAACAPPAIVADPPYVAVMEAACSQL